MLLVVVVVVVIYKKMDLYPIGFPPKMPHAKNSSSKQTCDKKNKYGKMGYGGKISGVGNMARTINQNKKISL